MHKKKISKNKNIEYKFYLSLAFLVLVVVVIGVFIVFTNQISKKQNTLNSRASENTKSAVSIVGGTDAQEGEFPFYALLNFKKGDTESFCGGALISDEWIITAAHCFVDLTNQDTVTAIIGMNHRKREMKGLHYSKIDRIIPHERYSGLKVAIVETFDIALLHLQDKAIGVPTLSLFDPKGGKFLEEIGSGLEESQNRTTVMGFGTTIKNNPSDFYPSRSDFSKVSITLKKAVLAMDVRRLLLYYDTILLYNPTGINSRTGPGDSGGPAGFRYMNKDYLLGISSRMGMSGSSLYTSASYYFSWIHEKTGIDADFGTYDQGMQLPEQKNLDVGVCEKATTIEACTESNNVCTWDSSVNTCLTWNTAICNRLKKADTCNNESFRKTCIWDSITNKCKPKSN